MDIFLLLAMLQVFQSRANLNDLYQHVIQIKLWLTNASESTPVFLFVPEVAKILRSAWRDSREEQITLPLHHE